ncbi:enoyl-CoA hydratase/isomerase family protein [Zavarzinia compransoris]|uniref:Enoyl-CoA hydratase n=1 Tax=Zavarzinia compransoris TaxID=1264899 RepID=A0A317E6V4_9PROT|nr:enoyl-CoA hydratase-related protein [Zavarzinia compransoris]PWR22014.1 enoyl-CoA hydratase [Zavarzinia compransoris]TDP47247.1 2-(1,2-epoxy-1,2-dihydrophenyl)acetyl-CoA isomerase [Zavarzinia compransoris]
MTDTPPAARLDLDGTGLAVITLNRGERGNPFGFEMARALRDIALTCDGDPAIRAVLLKAEGRNFCVGGDLNTFAAAGSLSRAVQDMVFDFHGALAKLARMRSPLIVAVQGAAAGVGVSLVGLADLVVAGASAHFTTAYGAIGFSTDGGMSYTLPRLIGLRRFQELYLTNRRLGAAEAQAIGLITEVVPDETVQDRALALARQIAAGPTVAYGKLRHLLLASYGNDFEGHLEMEARLLAEACRSDDVQEGIAAVLARRRPAFQGR